MIRNKPFYERIPSGMTAIEFLILLAAIGVVVLVSVPASSMLIERYRLNAAATDLVEGLNLARSEAIRRGSTVRVCPSANGRDCRSDGEWDGGWVVFSDGNGDGAVQDIELIETFEGPGEHVRVVAIGAVEQRASFTLNGLVADTPEARTGEFLVCYEGSDTAPKSIVIDADGWVRLAANGGANADCRSS